ncbi:hypothetical protein SKAU_G00033270 [Synaphobranchus kaupii]|uniref:Uncharacterized protein n=1 Tax=Synaphobranchus kaupii TaxID=118154 RepID=A0A9Q1GE99_SYNKA|nr:hypothetical protein SKAU_G00033270 [Synaphobranchus kaupii]
MENDLAIRGAGDSHGPPAWPVMRRVRERGYGDAPDVSARSMALRRLEAAPGGRVRLGWREGWRQRRRFRGLRDVWGLMEAEVWGQVQGGG